MFSLSLTSADGSALPAASPGQFLTVKVPLEADVPPLIRSYSLSGEPRAGMYRISVKVEPYGAASNRLRSRVRVGDNLDAAAPRGSFCLSKGSNPVVLLSAGVGVTPLLAMLHALARDRSTREVWWLHAARNGTEHPFAQESRDLIEELANARSAIYYSKPNDADRQGVDYTTAGRLSPDRIVGLGLPTDADAYLCGPVGFMNGFTTALVDAGLEPSRVHTEIFGAGPSLTPGIEGSSSVPAPHQPAGSVGTGPSVSFARSGLTVPWNNTQASLLELAEACDVPVQWSCRTGVCHTCELALMAGTVHYSPDPVEPPAEGNILICCSTPTEGVILDL
ncbi:2Fe-2S iron-sulfur cluster-binding protein [Streptomyces kaempferi]